MDHMGSGREIKRLAAAAAVLAAMALPTAACAVEPGLVPDLTWGISAADQARTAGQAQDLGSKWVRLTINWKDVEARPGQQSAWWLDHYENALAQARAAGQKVLVVFYTSPSWASGSRDENAPPTGANVPLYAAFVASMAQRFGGSIDAYEVWNEPNISRFWPGGPDPAAYANLLKAAYPALKAADPSAPVVFAGPSTNDYDFVDKAYKAGAKGSFDVMGAHPYSCSNPPDRIDRDANGRIKRDSFLGYREIRATMVDNGDPKPIWLTEFGWSTASGQCGVSEAQQAAYIQSAYKLLCQDPYVEVALYYNLRNNYWQRDADDIEAQYGLTRSDFSPKPAYAAYRAATAAGCSGSAASAPPAMDISLDQSSSGSFAASGTGASPAGSTVKLTLSKKKGRRWVRVRRTRAKVRSQRFRKKLGRARAGSWRLQARLPGRAAVTVSRRIRVSR
jgi:hypothetical protein